MTLPWIFIVPNVPAIVLRGQIAQTLDPDNSFDKGRIDAIDFSLEGFVVSAARLRGVATAVKDGRIGVEVADTGPISAPPTSWASAGISRCASTSSSPTTSGGRRSCTRRCTPPSTWPANRRATTSTRSFLPGSYEIDDDAAKTK